MYRLHYRYPNVVNGTFKRVWEEGDGNSDPDKGGSSEDVISKADFDAKVAELDKVRQELEDMKSEVLSADYLNFLDERDKKVDNNKDNPTDDKPNESKSDNTKGLTKEEVLALAEAKAEEKLSALKDAQTKKEVEAFSRSHPDFDRFRPTMYGLSTDPKNKDLTLQELYDKAKEHVMSIHTEASDVERQRQLKLKGEHPGGYSGSFDTGKKLDEAEATKEAEKEILETLGAPPAM